MLIWQLAKRIYATNGRPRNHDSAPCEMSFEESCLDSRSRLGPIGIFHNWHAIQIWCRSFRIGRARFEEFYIRRAGEMQNKSKHESDQARMAPFLHNMHCFVLHIFVPIDFSDGKVEGESSERDVPESKDTKSGHQE